MSLKAKLALGAIVAMAFAAVSPVVLASVGGNAAASATTAKVRVLHSAPDVPAVTVYVDGAPAIASLAPLETTGYLDLPAGPHTVSVALAGKPESEAVLRQTVTVEAGKRYTGFATGLLAKGTVKLGVTEDVTRAPFTRSSLRVWHNSPDAPAVDVIVNGQTALSNVPYETRSPYIPLPAGSYDVRINVAGTTTTVFEGSVALARGQSYTAVALGSVAGNGAPFGVKVLEDATSGALVRVLHASPNVPAVTVYVNGEPAVARLGTLKASGYLALDAGEYDVAVALAGQPVDKAVLRTTVSVADKTRYTALARGLLQGKGARKLELAAQRDIAVAPAPRSALRVWHLSPDAPRVDVLVNGRKVLSRVPYKAASSYLSLPAGSYRVQVNVAGTRTAVFRGTVRLAKDRAYTAAALGSVGRSGASFRVAVLPDA
jgi:hypothetical protein